MKLLGKLTPFFLLCLGMLGCNNDPFMEEQNIMGSGSNAIVKEISVTLPEITSDVDTRTEFKISEEGVISSWAEKDTIGVFPEKGNQVSFPMIDGVGRNTAIFDGGGWGLKASYAYAAYYPFNKANYLRDNKTILIDYTGQTQEGNESIAHLGVYDYLAAGQVRPNSSGSLKLELQRLGCLVMMELVIPRSDTYTSLTLSSSGAEFIKKAELDISGPEPQIIEKETSPTITLALNDITLEAGDILRAYLMCAPVDLTSDTLSVALDGEVTYASELESKSLEAGNFYKFSGSTFSPVGFINFADRLVKQICVSQWDTDKDGELSFEEAGVVTAIPNELFLDKTITSFNELKFFTNLNEIRNGAFCGCSRLTSIILPDGVTSIGGGAFYGCSSLASINIPDGVTRLSGSVFYGCSSLTSITIPDGVTEIANYVFYGCSSLTSITIPDGVTSIPNWTFQGCSSLTSITLPDGMLSLGSYAFANCSSLTSIDIPDGVTFIGNNTFYGCSSLTSITIPDGVTYIWDSTFNGCTSLTNITLPDGVTSMRDSTFYGCTSLTNITLPDGVTFIGKSTFEGCSNLTDISIPDGVTSIGDSAFEGCSSLTSITCNAITPPEIGSDVFKSTNDCPIYVSSASIETYKNTYRWRDYADRIQAFYIDDPIEFEDSVVKQFCLIQWDTNKDGELSYKEAAVVTEIPRLWFSEKVITSFNELRYFINLNVIREDAFSGCSSLTSITLPGGVTSIGESAFSGCNNLTSINIPSGVTSIGGSTFSGCSSITRFVLPNGVTSIGESAFSGCTSLTSINIPDGVTSIGESAFSGCYKLTSIYIPGGVTSIEKNTFSGCGGLTTIYFTDGVTSIGDSAFERCFSLTSITLPNGVTRIGNSAFQQCSNLTSITLPDAVTSIGMSSFQGCNNLVSINIPNGVTSIGESAFLACYKLTSINIPDGLTEIATGCFEKCGLTSVTIPNGVTSIGSRAFQSCTFLTSLTLPDGLTEIRTLAFYGCALTSLTLPGSVTSIWDSAFYLCSSLTSITCCSNVPLFLSSNAFDITNNCPIYVPASSVETYKAAYGWEAYADRIQAIQ